MKRVLYFTGYRMVAQEWQGTQLAGSVYFEPDEQGLDLFGSYLKSFKNEPVRLLVDLIEEEFRQIKIPLVRGGDRKAILDRNFSKYFRNSEFRFAISQATEKKARKEEKLLLIGLTNQHLLEPWLKIIDESQTPLSGIISLPLVSESYIPKLEVENRVVILVSQQVPSNLRQSVFIDGKLILSRLVPIASFYQGDYASDLLRDVESTQRYLISQRIVERSERVSVHILANKRHYDKLVVRTEKETFFDFKIHEINQLLESEKVEMPDEQDFSSGLFCYLASKPLAINHYARSREKKYYNHHLTGIGLKVASAALFAVALGMAGNSLVKGWLYNDSISQNALIEQKYRSKYNQLQENFEGSATSTAAMKSLVNTVATVRESYLTDPREMLQAISQDVSLFPDLRVKNISWFITNNSLSGSAGQVTWGKKPRSRRGRDRNAPKPVPGFFEVVNLEMELIDFNGDFRYALSVVDDLEKSMVESGKYFSVAITKRPLDVESTKKLSGDISGGRGNANQRAAINIRVVKEVIQDA